MVKSVIRDHHFSPAIIDSLFLDDIDFYGLEFYYNDIREMNNELKKKKK